NRQLALTQRGQQLLNIADQTFNSLERSLSDLQGENISGQLSLSASPSLAQHWLGAAIAAFKLQYPQLCVYLHTHNAQSPLSNPQLDLAITYGGPDYPGLHSEKLREEQLQVLCNEAYMQKMQLEHSPERLIHCQFIHDALAQPHAGPLCEWNHWLERAGLSAISPRPDMCFDMSALALNAAEQGCGVAIGRWSLSRERLARGSLVSPFDKVVQADAAYYLVCHPERRQSPVVQCLIDFLWDYIRTPTFESTLY
ncbi:MAG: LysR substrate-binding domain-containing protein, partial [Pseudomonadales bacterium]